MKIVATINQSDTIYTIKQFGNASFRIDFKHINNRRINHVNKVFDNEKDCREYISTCSSMDAMIDLIDYNDQYQRDNIKRIVVKVNRKTQPDIIEHLQNIDNVNGYIIDLIRKDMDK